MRINLILPTYNNYDLTIKCLKSIKKHKDKNYNINIIWIDNNSDINNRNNVYNFLVKNTFDFDKIFLSNNLGFIKAVNIALKYALKKYLDDEFIGIINNDIEVSKNWLKNLIKCFENDEKIMCAGSISYNSNNKSIDLRDINFNNELRKLNNESFIETSKNVIKNINVSYKLFDINAFNNFDDAIVPYYSVIFKTSIFNKIGYLNENFNFGYCDDTELNYRICKAGYKIAKVFNSIILHNSRSTFKLINNDNYKINLIQKCNKLILKLSKTLNENKEKKYVIYTCIIGDYDNLKPISTINTNLFDYICFTNSKKIEKSNVYPWKIINIKDIEGGLLLDDESDFDKQVKFARFVKTHPHLFFENYERSIWIDANIDVIGDAHKYINLLTNDHYILTASHPVRNNIYEEILACKKLNKEDSTKLNYINKFLLNENFPKNTFLVQSGILVRDHNNEQCKFLMEKWWEMIKNFSKRDQLSFNYIFWKYGGKYLSLPWDLIKLSYFITDYKHKEKEN